MHNSHAPVLSALVVCRVSCMHPHTGAMTWTAMSQLLSGKWTKSLLPGVTQHKQTHFVQLCAVSIQRILLLPLQITAAQSDEN